MTNRTRTCCATVTPRGSKSLIRKILRPSGRDRSGPPRAGPWGSSSAGIWLPRLDSNQEPTGPKPAVLPITPRGIGRRSLATRVRLSTTSCPAPQPWGTLASGPPTTRRQRTGASSAARARCPGSLSARDEHRSAPSRQHPRQRASMCAAPTVCAPTQRRSAMAPTSARADAQCTCDRATCLACLGCFAPSLPGAAAIPRRSPRCSQRVARELSALVRDVMPASLGATLGSRRGAFRMDLTLAD